MAHLASNRSTSASKSIAGRVILLVLLVLTLILLPFFLFEERMAHLAATLLQSPSRPLVALAVVGLLSADVFLPVPSSVVSVASGSLLGLVGGTVASFVGLSLGCFAGYFTGFVAAPKNARSGAADIERVRRVALRYGDGFVVLCRAVPVLAEASVVFAGMARMPLLRFALLTGIANFAISFIYAAIGNALFPARFFLPVFLAVVLVPLLLMAFRLKRKAVSTNTDSVTDNPNETIP